MMLATELSLGAATGLVLGTAYFGLLWWTVQRLPTRSDATRFYFRGLLIRTLMLILGLALLAVSIGHVAVLAGMVGIGLARRLMLGMYGGLGANRLQSREPA